MNYGERRRRELAERDSERAATSEQTRNPPKPTHELEEGVAVCRWCGLDSDAIQRLELVKQDGFQCPKAPPPDPTS